MCFFQTWSEAADCIYTSHEKGRWGKKRVLSWSGHLTDSARQAPSPFYRAGSSGSESFRFLPRDTEQQGWISDPTLTPKSVSLSLAAPLLVPILSCCVSLDLVLKQREPRQKGKMWHYPTFPRKGINILLGARKLSATLNSNIYLQPTIPWII